MDLDFILPNKRSYAIAFSSPCPSAACKFSTSSRSSPRPKKRHCTLPVSPLTTVDTDPPSAPTLSTLIFPALVAPSQKCFRPLTFLALPTDIHYQILSHLPEACELYPLRCLNTYFRHLIDDSRPFLFHRSLKFHCTNFDRYVIVDDKGSLTLSRRKGEEVVRKADEGGNAWGRLLWEGLFSWDCIIENDNNKRNEKKWARSERRGLRAVTVGWKTAESVVGSSDFNFCGNVKVVDGLEYGVKPGWVVIHRAKAEGRMGTGGVWGVVDVFGCEKSPRYSGKWRWKIGRTRKLKNMVFCAGFRGVWRVSECLAENVIAQIDE